MARVDLPGPETGFSDSAPQLLATEHWSLLAGRSGEWNEAFARTGVFLNVLSASVVALALVADATDFGDGFETFALVLFPLVLFLGVATYLRLVEINFQDVHYVVAMNRLRQAYLQIAPELKPFFTAGLHDDLQGIMQTFTLGAHSTNPPVHFLVTTPTVVATVDAIIAAAGAALIADRSGQISPGVAGAITFVVVWAGLYGLQLRAFWRLRRTFEPRFPAPSGNEGEG